MPTLVSYRTTLRTLAIVAAIGASTSLSGCAHLATAYNGLWLRCQTKHDLANIRQDTRQEMYSQLQDAQRLAAEREVEQARLAAERARLESELCRANQEALHQQVRNNLKNVLESKVAFNVEHGLEVGELEVDTEALQQLLKERENPPPTAPFTSKPPCSCCDQPCRCGSGFLRRLCPHCRHKPCEAEKTCGGPEAFTQLQQQPLRQPLRPAEIPMKLPVRLSYGFQQPVMEQARIRTQPVIPISPFTQVPCTEGVPCPNGVCPQPGQHGFAPQQSPGTSVGLPPRDGYFDPAAAPLPPTPVPDNEARRQSPASSGIQPVRLGMREELPGNLAWQTAR